MTNTATETTEDEITPFVDNDREIAYRSEATPHVPRSSRSTSRGSSLRRHRSA